MAKNRKIKIKRALVSVSDKTGIVDFARKLHKLNIEVKKSKLFSRQSIDIDWRRSISRESVDHSGYSTNRANDSRFSIFRE